MVFKKITRDLFPLHGILLVMFPSVILTVVPLGAVLAYYDTQSQRQLGKVPPRQEAFIKNGKDRDRERCRGEEERRMHSLLSLLAFRRLFKEVASWRMSHSHYFNCIHYTHSTQCPSSHLIHQQQHHTIHQHLT